MSQEGRTTEDKTTVVSSGGGSGIAIVAIIVLLIIFMLAFFAFSRGISIVVPPINVNVTVPTQAAPPAKPTLPPKPSSEQMDPMQYGYRVVT